VFGAGAGYMSFRSDCENCEHGDNYTSGRGFLVDAGLTLNEKFDGGAEVFTAVSGDDLNHYRTTYTLAVGQFRPWRAKASFSAADSAWCSSEATSRSTGRAPRCRRGVWV